jgi:hypothetical protein
MSAALADWLAELRTPLEIPDFEPEIDDKDAKKDAALRYTQSLCVVASNVRLQLPCCQPAPS